MSDNGFGTYGSSATEMPPLMRPPMPAQDRHGGPLPFRQREARRRRPRVAAS